MAGRTDAGVHASGQVASLAADGGPPTDRLAEAINAILSDDVAVIAVDEAPADFHARFSATARSYRYVVLNRRVRSALTARRSLWWPRALDDAALEGSAALLVGEHDFTAFTPTGTHHEVFRRVVQAAAWERQATSPFHGHGWPFLRHMVRTLVGTMLETGPDAWTACCGAGRGPRQV